MGKPRTKYSRFDDISVACSARTTTQSFVVENDRMQALGGIVNSGHGRSRPAGVCAAATAGAVNASDWAMSSSNDLKRNLLSSCTGIGKVRRLRKQLYCSLHVPSNMSCLVFPVLLLCLHVNLVRYLFPYGRRSSTKKLLGELSTSRDQFVLWSRVTSHMCPLLSLPSLYRVPPWRYQRHAPMRGAGPSA